MTSLDRASRELFTREPDERCESLQEMWQRCLAKREASQDRWEPPNNIRASSEGKNLHLSVGNDGYWLNDWSFSQLCRMAGVAKDTVNRLSPDTASSVFRETIPGGGTKPLQLFTEGDVVRSIHGTSYTRLWNVEVVNVLKEFAVDFEPPQKGFNGATGLYVGEQDMFAFLIDPNGWTEIGGEAFAPGFFVWNSEVGRRTVGIQSFWFQAVCQNHIVFDAVEVVEWKRRHTARVGDGLGEIRRIIENLVEKRDERKDGFAAVIRKAMEATVDGDEALKLLGQKGITRTLAKKALELATQKGALTIFSVVDALTSLARDLQNAGDRNDLDAKSSQLLELV